MFKSFWSWFLTILASLALLGWGLDSPVFDTAADAAQLSIANCRLSIEADGGGGSNDTPKQTGLPAIGNRKSEIGNQVAAATTTLTSDSTVCFRLNFLGRDDVVLFTSHAGETASINRQSFAGQIETLQNRIGLYQNLLTQNPNSPNAPDWQRRIAQYTAEANWYGEVVSIWTFREQFAAELSSAWQMNYPPFPG